MLELLLVAFCCLISIPVIVFFVQVVMASIEPRVIEDEVTEKDSRIVVLIPAHNEESVIAETIKSVKSQLKEDDRVLVVADNCSDNTADIAVNLGVEVLVREDDIRLGKGYALEFGIAHIDRTEDKPDVVVVVDADCIVNDGSLVKLVDRCSRIGRPVQALYLMHSNEARPARKIAEFAWVVKNWVRPSGYLRLGLPCHLMGTGMAFPFELLRKSKFVGAHIVEDMKLGIDMARNGYYPEFYSEACVVSYFPDEEKNIESQRTRWEHGHLGIFVSESIGLLGTAISKRDLRLLAMALDLTIPPLAFVAIILFAAFSATGLAGLFTSVTMLPFLIMLLACGLFSVSVILAWAGFARNILTPGDLISIPGYIIRKIPMYVRFWTRRQKDWIRTGRD